MDESHSEMDSMQKHNLADEWCLWAHLPHDTDWSLNSYKQVYNCNTIEETVLLYDTLPMKLVKNCMLFMMRKGITPLWEDSKNRDGGCFSYKVTNKHVHECWKKLSYSLLGEFLSSNKKLQESINGITISPKKNFCIIKIWMGNCNHQNANEIYNIPGLDNHGCLFKKHAPEY